MAMINSSTYYSCKYLSSVNQGNIMCGVTVNGVQGRGGGGGGYDHHDLKYM